MSTVATAAGARGFDLNQPVKHELAERFYRTGYRFVLRYVPRLTPKSHDLTNAELETLHTCGLAVMPVQHVLSESSWMPTANRGSAYGKTAGEYSELVGVDKGTNVWLDLEGVAPGVPAAETITYCNNWYDKVASFGFTPGIYVGWNCGLNASELYYRLKFKHYWGAYNLNRDEWPAVRSLQMKQKLANKQERAEVGFDPFNVDLISGDKLGNFPKVCAPEGWSAL